MKRVNIALVTAVAALIALPLGVAPASAADEEIESDLTVVEIESTPGWEWTDEAIAEAVGASDEIAIEPQARGAQARGLFPTPFPEEPQQSVSFPHWVATMPSSVVHKGLNHPSTIGKIVSQRIVNGELGTWSCTGTVVSSTSGSLVITAGHCIWPRDSDQVLDTVFIPAYHEDILGGPVKPYGEWNVTSAIAQDCWIEDKDSACDQAFLKVAPQHDGTRLQNLVGSLGLAIGGSPVRGVSSEVPKRFPLTMHGYPEAENKYEEGNDPDKSRVYLCDSITTEASDQDAVFAGAIQDACNEPMTGGASGAAFVERQPAGQMVIATVAVRIADSPDHEIVALLNNTMTKTMHAQLNAHVPLS